VFYLGGRFDDAIREYRRELTFLTHAEHALRERSLIEVRQKLAAAYARLGDTATAAEFAAQAREGFERRLAAGSDDPFTRYYAAALAAERHDVDGVLAHLARPLAELGAFTRWRLPRDPDFAELLADPRLAAVVTAAAA
jgi:hypothetical protein